MEQEKQYEFDLIGVGSPVVDTLVHIDDAFLSSRQAEKGGMVLIDEEGMEDLLKALPKGSDMPGGSSGNTAYTCALLGVRTTFLGKIGPDAIGDFYRECFRGAGGNDERFKVGRISNGRCISMVTPDGERTMRTHLGAAATLDPADVSPLDFAGCRHAHVEGYLAFNPDLLESVLLSAHRAGCTISLDLASFEVVRAAKETLPRTLQHYIDVALANEEEAEAFFGDGMSHAEMALELAKMSRIGIVKAGKEGAYLAEGKNVVHVTTDVVSKPVDTTGAGDIWAAGFLYGWLNGESLEVAGQYGAILGSAIVQHLGPHLPKDAWPEVHERLKAVKVTA
ncbi:MAG: PfkB domain-containing protein [Puniceicoccaceae bacterium 5H]|nr:MAG: PfkB domain-containing protein [Puniceicoccaceae bacterium 5H]